MNMRPKRQGHRGRPEGSDKDINKQTGTGRQGGLVQLAVTSGKRGVSSVMANTPDRSGARNESCVGARAVPRNKHGMGLEWGRGVRERERD